MKKHLATVLAILFGIVLITGCGQSKEPEAEEPSETLYPITINDVEIRVGETTVQALLDQGLNITVSEMGSGGVSDITTYEVDPETDLEPNSYYSGASIWISDTIFAHISSRAMVASPSFTVSSSVAMEICAKMVSEIQIEAPE